MNILCVIPARGNSKRVPRKNIRVLLDKPLIAYSIEAAKKSKLCNRVAVSTDDERIAEAAKKYGAEVVMRPDEIATDTSPIDDAIRHVVRTLQVEQGYDAEIIVELQANVPVRKEGEIDDVVKKLLSTKDATAIATAYVVEQRPEWMKVRDIDTGAIQPFIAPTELYLKQSLPDLYLLDGAIIAIKGEILMQTEGLRTAHAYLGDKVHIEIHDKRYSVEIDEEGDFEVAEYYLLKEKK